MALVRVSVSIARLIEGFFGAVRITGQRFISRFEDFRAYALACTLPVKGRVRLMRGGGRNGP